MMNRTRSFWLAPAVLLGASLAHADGVRMYGAGEIPQANEVAEILSGGAAMYRPKMRGISLDPVQPSHDKVGPDVQTIATPQNTVVGLPVEFAFNSAAILPENEAQLDAVAQGIKMTGGITVLVEGHTDAHGPESYNDHLSLKRAEAVKEYLISKHGISAARLVVAGRGESEPINAANPFAGENRRVQLRAAN